MKKRIFSALLLLLLALFAWSCGKTHLHVGGDAYLQDQNGHWRLCAECGEICEYETHRMEEPELVSCTGGSYTARCSVCGYEAEVTVRATGSHVWSSVTDDGVTLKRYCEKCRVEDRLTTLPETSRYGYAYLASLPRGDIFKADYLQLSEAIRGQKSSAPLKGAVSKADAELIFYCVVADHPEYFWISGHHSYRMAGNSVQEVLLEYTVSESRRISMEEELSEAAIRLLAGVSSRQTDFEKELAIHDAMLQNAVYDVSLSATDAHTAYGNLVLKRSVCDGYTKGFQYLLSRCGILATTLVGYSGEHHSWNAVCLDGEWYACDLTWDDPLGSGVGDVSYTYFNQTDATFAFDHSYEEPDGTPIENYYPIPACNGTRYRFFNFFGYGGALTAQNLESVIVAQIKAGYTRQFFFRTEGHGETPAERETALVDFMDTLPVRFYQTVATALGRKVADLSLQYSVSKDGFVLTLIAE